MITKLILDKVRKWDMLPTDINNGLCDQFVMEIIEELGGYADNLYELCTENFIKDHRIGHVWVYYKGKHYDSETPSGVDNWMDLPLFKLYNVRGYLDLNIFDSKGFFKGKRGKDYIDY